MNTDIMAITDQPGAEGDQQDNLGRSQEAQGISNVGAFKSIYEHTNYSEHTHKLQ